jgi:hypothetical protein
MALLMVRGTSGYMSIYDGSVILEYAVWSVVPSIGELFAVNGGYRWMSAYLRATERGPARSIDQVHDMINGFQLPTNVYEDHGTTSWKRGLPDIAPAGVPTSYDSMRAWFYSSIPRHLIAI